MLKGVIFDFNGTMVQDAPFHAEAWRRYLKQIGARKLTEREWQEDIFGKDNVTIFHQIIGEELSDGKLLEMGEEKEAVYRQVCLEQSARYRLSEGLEEALNQLKDRGVRLNMATGSVRANLDFYLEYFHIDRWFEPEKIVYEDNIVPSKPDPAFYLKAIDNLELKPEECIVVEDSLPGIEAARGAGVGKLVVITSCYSRERLETIEGIDRIIDSFEGFADLVEELKRDSC